MDATPGKSSSANFTLGERPPGEVRCRMILRCGIVRVAAVPKEKNEKLDSLAIGCCKPRGGRRIHENKCFLSHQTLSSRKDWDTQGRGSLSKLEGGPPNEGCLSSQEDKEGNSGPRGPASLQKAFL